MRALETRIPDPSELTAVLRWLAGGLLLISLSVSSSGCEKQEARTSEQMLVGRWEMKEIKVSAETGPGDGSYLEFDACSNGVCTGRDYMASNGTTGNFTWRMDADGRKITIDDFTPDGGYYNNTWDVLELSETALRITTPKSPFPAVFAMKRVK